MVMARDEYRAKQICHKIQRYLQQFGNLTEKWGKRKTNFRDNP